MPKNAVSLHRELLKSWLLWPLDWKIYLEKMPIKRNHLQKAGVVNIYSPLFCINTSNWSNLWTASYSTGGSQTTSRLEATCEWPILNPFFHKIQKQTTHSIGLFLMPSSNFQALTLVHVLGIIVQSVLPQVCYVAWKAAWSVALLAQGQEEMIIPFTNKNLVEGQWCCVLFSFIRGVLFKKQGVSVLLASQFSDTQWFWTMQWSLDQVQTIV